MFRRQEFLQSFQNHFSFLFQAIQTRQGAAFTEMEYVPFPQDVFLRQNLLMQLWDHALEKESYDCFHTLSLYTDPDILINVFELALYHHQVHAIVPLIACLQRNNQFIQLGNVQCNQKQCKTCMHIREQLLVFFAFEEDWKLVRKKLREARQKNLWTMWKPQLLLNPQTDVITKKIFEKTKKGWNVVVAATFASILWKRWLERQLHPSSSYVNNVLSKRFSTLLQKYI